MRRCSSSNVHNIGDCCVYSFSDDNQVIANPILSDLVGIVVCRQCQRLHRRTSFRMPTLYRCASISSYRPELASCPWPSNFSLSFTMILPIVHTIALAICLLVLLLPVQALYSRGPIKDSNDSFADGLNVTDISLAYLQWFNVVEWHAVLSVANTCSLTELWAIVEDRGVTKLGNVAHQMQKSLRWRRCR